MLDAAYRTSGLTVQAIAEASGLPAPTVRTALAGYRYRNGEPRRVVPPDPTVARLASVLGVSAETLTGLGREQAAALMDEEHHRAATPRAAEAQAAIEGRRRLAEQVLAVFSTDELRAEVQRREREQRG